MCSQTHSTRRLVSTREEQKGCIAAILLGIAVAKYLKYCPVHPCTITEQTTLWCNAVESFSLLTVLSTSMLNNAECANRQDLDGFFGRFFCGREVCWDALNINI